MYSGARAARRAAKRSPILIWERKGNPRVDFLMVITASGFACGHVRTTTVESSKMAVILQIIVGWQRHAALVYHVLFDIWHVYGWQNGAKFTKFIFIHIQHCYCCSRIYLFTFNNRVYVQEICLFTFDGVFLIHEYIYSHLRQDLRDVLIHAWCLFNSYVYLSTFSSLCGLTFPG